MKAWRLMIVVLVLMAGLSAGVGGCPQTGPQLNRPAKNPGPPSGATVRAGSTLPAPGPPRRVEDERNGIALFAPADWKAEKRTGNPALFLMAPQATAFGPLVNVVIEDLNQRLNPYDYLMANLPGMRISLPGLVFKTGGVEENAGISMAWITYTYPRGEIELTAMSYCQTRDYKAYVVTGMAPSNLFPQNEQTFRSIGRSLRIN
jgi:hypothetical protein